MHDPYTPLEVTEAIRVFNLTLSAAHPAVLVEGEVASFKVNHGKFAFFDIKDKISSLSCFMMAFQLKFPLEDGMRVRLIAEPKLTDWGKFSLTVREVIPIGEGSIKKSFEILKKRLENEGLFDESRKRSIPYAPKRVGVVSSEQAAGFADFRKILEKRWSGVQVILTHVPVQGVEAPNEIIGAIGYLNELAKPVDVVAIIRGGGSLDDLAAFNHEGVARAVSASRAPVIVGVGHETDITLADLVADVRAATPSHVAELLVPDKSQVIKGLQQQTTAIHRLTTAIVSDAQEKLTERRSLVTQAVNTFFNKTREHFDLTRRTLHQLNPEVVLQRGYSIVRIGDNVISHASDVTIGDEINITVRDGVIGANVRHVD